MAQAPEYIKIFVDRVDYDSFSACIKRNEEELAEMFAIPQELIRKRFKSDFRPISSERVFINPEPITPYGKNLYRRKLRIRR